VNNSIGADSRLQHYVAPEPFAPYEAERLTPEQERFYRASAWQVMWWKFRRHRIAVICLAILAALYASTLVSEVLAPYELNTRDSRHIYAPPQDVHLFHEGRFIGPFVYGYTMKLNMDALVRAGAGCALLREETALENTRLTADQCREIVSRGSARGLLAGSK